MSEGAGSQVDWIETSDRHGTTLRGLASRPDWAGSGFVMCQHGLCRAVYDYCA
ncbi:MAG: hypothetical protein AVDCRST_MAG33-615 [uncultured Thermomicrobiales bacterium]|uniref:Uncharacterized protein n=1 Tax=uncultured Thermomicrobiales bacterium TaxID=1645740 RepID=A0A6J4UHV6_9BACT|nr:MAG: hypothetical protein AVDCRST_MAG33-615 [uncultured Thermomicrobiales bacterium]